jgi:hypothetical protein
VPVPSPVIGPGLRETLSKYLPTWLGNVPGFRNLYSVIWTVALIGDALREIVWEGQLAAYPGVGTPTANPLIAQSRGLLQGPNETSAAFAIRAINWLTTAKQIGSPIQLVSQIQTYLVGQGSLGAGIYPVVMVVDRSGRTVTANADQSITEGTVTWAWDNLGGWVDGAGYHAPVEVDGWWSDNWLVIQDPWTHYTSFTDAAWLAAWETGDQTVDTLTPQAIVAGVLQLVGWLKGQHMFVRAISWVPTPSSFVPNGYYGNASHNVAGTQTQERNNALAYWEPLGGG